MATWPPEPMQRTVPSANMPKRMLGNKQMVSMCLAQPIILCSGVERRNDTGGVCLGQEEGVHGVHDRRCRPDLVDKRDGERIPLKL